MFKKREIPALKCYHLGNVNVVISDRKLSIDLVNNTTFVATPDGLTDNYLADVLSATDFYSYGAPMPGRAFNSNTYRYGVNGQEKDDEITGITGAHITADYLDPLVKHGESPYATFIGNPRYVRVLGSWS